MGNQQTKLKSTTKEIETNLLWSLEEHAHWLQQCSTAKEILQVQDIFIRPMKGELTTELQLIQTNTNNVIQLVDDILHGRNLPQSTFGGQRTYEIPQQTETITQTHPIHCGLASQMFGASATEQVAINVTTIHGPKVNEPFHTSHSGPYVESLESLASSNQTASSNVLPSFEATNGAAPIADTTKPPSSSSETSQPQELSEKVSTFISSLTNSSLISSLTAATQSAPNTSTIAADSKPEFTSKTPIPASMPSYEETAPMGSGTVPGSITSTAGSTSPFDSFEQHLSAVSHAALEQSTKERVEIAAKYLFINSLLEKMIHSAEHSYKTYIIYESLRKRNKLKRRKSLSESEQIELNKQFEEQSILLFDALASFDRARESLHWLYRDFFLEMAIHKLNDQLMVTRSFRELCITYELLNTRINEIDTCIFLLENKKNELNSSILANEKDALNLGLSFLDKNSSGALESTDVPEMSSILFELLQDKEKQVITQQSMHKALSLLAENLDTLNVKIRTLQTHNQHLQYIKSNDPLIAINNDNILLFQKQAEEVRNTLRTTYKVFLNSFAKVCFNKIEGQVQSQTIDVNLLFRDLQILEHSIKIITNPFQIQTNMEQKEFAIETAPLAAPLDTCDLPVPVPAMIMSHTQADVNTGVSMPMSLASDAEFNTSSSFIPSESELQEAKTKLHHPEPELASDSTFISTTPTQSPLPLATSPVGATETAPVTEPTAVDAASEAHPASISYIPTATSIAQVNTDIPFPDDVVEVPKEVAIPPSLPAIPEEGRQSSSLSENEKGASTSIPHAAFVPKENQLIGAAASLHHVEPPVERHVLLEEPMKLPFMSTTLHIVEPDDKLIRSAPLASDASVDSTIEKPVVYTFEETTEKPLPSTSTMATSSTISRALMDELATPPSEPLNIKTADYIPHQSALPSHHRDATLFTAPAPAKLDLGFNGKLGSETPIDSRSASYQQSVPATHATKPIEPATENLSKLDELKLQADLLELQTKENISLATEVNRLAHERLTDMDAQKLIDPIPQLQTMQSDIQQLQQSIQTIPEWNKTEQQTNEKLDERTTLMHSRDRV